MTKIRAGFILISFPLLLSACGGNDANTNTSPTTKVKQSVELIPLQRGERIYTRCRACHTLEDGQKNKVGPNLFGIMGRKAGTKEGFPYSKVMTASEVVWTDDTLDAFLTRPRDFMPGNRMSFIGLKSEEDRAAVIEFIKLKTGSISSVEDPESP